MHELRLVSEARHQLKPLVQAALENELRLVEAGIRRTERSLRKFEEQFHLSTDDFIAGYENDEMDESLEFAEWVGESRMLARLHDKADALRSIRIAN